MTEHATLFQPDMVRAVLRDVDPKTQTRRLITARNSLVDGAGMSPKRWDAMGFDFSRAWVDAGSSPAGNPGPYLKVPAGRGRDETVHRIYPRVQPGDTIWGRETHQFDAPCDGTWPHTSFYGCKGAPLDLIPERFRHPRYVLYSADWLHGRIKWRPGIHMPRWASRIERVITDVRVERLLEISEEDALAEGIERYNGPLRWVKYVNPMNPDKVYHSAAAAYLGLWETINGPDTAMLNPLVWAYSFTPRKQP